jgi:hypothetical protein
MLIFRDSLEIQLQPYSGAFTPLPDDFKSGGAISDCSKFQSEDSKITLSI